MTQYSRTKKTISLPQSLSPSLNLPLPPSISLSQRPTAGELLKHKFLRQARKTSYLCELVERFVRWKLENGEDSLSLSSQDITE